MALITAGIIGSVIAGLRTVIGGWAERKRVRLESEVKVAEATAQAKAQYVQAAQQGDIAWENTSIRNAGWKDEWFVIVLSIPAVMCFIPGMDQYVYKGFEALKNCPRWYQWALMIAIASSFGYKKFADFMAFKRGA